MRTIPVILAAIVLVGCGSSTEHLDASDNSRTEVVVQEHAVTAEFEGEQRVLRHGARRRRVHV
jgi:uncharacterized protein YcfL